MPSQTVFGLQTRYDDINVGLEQHGRARSSSRTRSSTTSTRAMSASMPQNTTHWTDWWRTTLGLRGDYFAASVNSMLQPANSGNPSAVDRQPEIHHHIRPVLQNRVLSRRGHGLSQQRCARRDGHRGARRSEHTEGASPFLVRTVGAEIGARTKIVPGLDSSVSLFYLHQNSELFFDGDTGTTVPGPPSLRTGIEITNNYRPVSWVRVDADLALSRARFLGFDTAQEQLYESLAGFPQAQIGNAPGNFISNAPWMVASAGITLGEKTGWFSASALALYQFAAAHRGRRFPVTAAQHHQRPGGLSVRQRLAHPA